MSRGCRNKGVPWDRSETLLVQRVEALDICGWRDNGHISGPVRNPPTVRNQTKAAEINWKIFAKSAS